MNKVNLPIIGIKPLPQGGIAVLTRPGKTNPSPNGVHVLKQAQAERIATRVLGFASPFAVALLIQAVGASVGQASLTVDAIEHKAGDAWENKTTGQKGTYGEKNGGKDWTEYRNHEITLGVAAQTALMSTMLTTAMQTASPIGAVAAVAPARTPVAITEETPSGPDQGGSTNDEPAKDIEA